jgi:hypothetical protein
MTPDLQRRLALALAVLIPLLLIIGLGMKASGWMQLREDISQAEAERVLPPAADPARYLTPGENFAVASSNLQSRVTSAARDAGVTASRVQIDPQSGDEPLLMVLDFQAEGELTDLAALLHALESGVPALIVEQVRLTPIRRSSQLQLSATLRARREPGSGS